MGNTLTCEDFDIGDIVKMISPKTLLIRKGAMGKVIRITDEFLITIL